MSGKLIVLVTSIDRLGEVRSVAICVALSASVAAAFYVTYSANLTSLLA